MVRRRKLLFISITIIIIFLLTTNFLLTKLTINEKEVKTIEEKIYQQLEALPPEYTVRKSFEDEISENFIKNLQSPKENGKTLPQIWKIANLWVSKDRIIDLQSPYLGNLYYALKKAKIIKANLDTRGTQLKLLLTLEGNQEVVFKPKWYDKETMIEGPVYAGKDRYGAEIVAFYLSAILNMPLTPFSVERKISLTHDVIPVATKNLINTSFELGNRTCIYGKCFYCKKQDPICEDKNYFLLGTVIFNLNVSLKSYRSPWQRTYKKNKRANWEENDNYCKSVKQKLSKRRLLDLVDTAIFDFLIQNGDRHHYETLNDNVILLDNGKSFGNANISHLDILAPLYQCCVLRNVTLKKLQNLAGGVLREKLNAMPDIHNLMTEAHLNAMEKRLLLIFATVEYCKKRNFNSN